VEFWVIGRGGSDVDVGHVGLVADDADVQNAAFALDLELRGGFRLRRLRRELYKRPLLRATGPGALGNRTIGTTAVGGMLLGTVVGVLVIPGLYYLFDLLTDKRPALIRGESDERLSQIVQHPDVHRHSYSSLRGS
jgi:hypothetical protein